MSSRNWSPAVARAMHEFGAAAPIPPSLDEVRARPCPAPQRGRAVPIVAAALVVAGAIGTIAALSRDNGSVTDRGGHAVMVQHSRYEVVWEAELECDTPIEDTAGVRSVVIDTWSDRTGRQWRQQMTYPNGETRDVILRGSAAYPTQQFERGELPDSALGCVSPNDESFVLVAGPSLPHFVTLAPELTPDERPYMQLFDDVGVLSDGSAVDAQGRPSERWSLRVGGTAGYNELAQFPTTQVTTWWVDPLDGATVLQRTFSNEVETLGSATLTETLVLQETIPAPDGLFDTDGFTEVGTTPRPDVTDQDPDTTIVVSPLRARSYTSG